MPGPTPEVYLRLGSHSEKQYVLKTAGLFQGVLVGANLLESTPGATVSLAIKILGGLNKAFAIDPMTYTFGMDLGYIQSETIDRTSRKPGARKVSLKRSFANLAKHYGEPVSSRVLTHKKPVSPAEFSGNLITDFSRAVFNYQVMRMKFQWDADPQLNEFAKELPAPSFVFSPYFYTHFERTGGAWKAWHELNVSLARSFAQIETDLPKHSVLCIDQSVLRSRSILMGIGKEYIETGCNACWLWFSKLIEQDIEEDELYNLVGFTNQFRDAGIALYNSHGGYLSALLSKHGMTGFSHGVGYGESKDVVPIIGVTIPTVNYHLPPLHVRVPMLELERALPELKIRSAADFHSRICDCTVCKGILKGQLSYLHEFGDTVTKVGNIRESQTPDSAKKCRFHFLLARKKEVEKVAATSLVELKRHLNDKATEYSNLPSYLGLSGRAQHLRTWSAGI